MQNDNFNPNQPPEYNPINQAEQPIMPTDPQPIISAPFTPPTPPPKKSKKGLIIILAVAGLALLIAGAIVAYLLIQPKNTGNTTITDQTETQAVPEDTTDFAKVLIDRVQTAGAALTAKNPTVKVTTIEASAPAYKTDANNYYITGDIGYTISIAAGEADLNKSKSTVKEDIITAANTALSSDTALTKTNTASHYIYQSSAAICAFLKEGYPLHVSCANKRDYTALSESLKPFVDAFTFSQGKTNLTTTLFGKPVVTKKDGGYTNASVSISSYEGTSGYTGLFYGNENQWIFWKGTQNALACSDYNTYALQESFKDTACVDATGAQSKVSVAIR